MEAVMIYCISKSRLSVVLSECRVYILTVMRSESGSTNTPKHSSSFLGGEYFPLTY